MKSFLKGMYAWAEMFFQTIVSLLSVLIFAKISVAKGMSSLLVSRQKRNVIILGNGPSIKPILSDRLQDLMEIKADRLTVNFFCTSQYFEQIKPSLYVLSDPAFFNISNEDRIEKHKEQAIESLRKVDWNMRLFVPYNSKGATLLNKVASNQFIEITYYNLVPVKAFFQIERFLFKYNLGMPCPLNVTNAAIFLMINMRYQDIYLLGADHSWLKEVHVSEQNEVIMGYEHFYGDTSYYKIDSTLSQWLKTEVKTFESHDMLQRYAVSCDVNVYNSTKGSFIDAYSRKYLFE